MDSNHQIESALYTKSYYVTVLPRAGALVGNQGAYTISFNLVTSAGVILSTKTVKIDFVTTSAKADAVLTLATSGTFLAAAALTTQDTAAATYATLTIKSRDNGLVRQGGGQNVVPSATIQWIRTGAVTSDTVTLVANDTGTYGSDFGRNSTTSPGNGTLQKANGVFGLTGTLPLTASATGNTYQLWAGYGNATIVTSALTVYNANGSGTAATAKTDVQLTATGILATDALKVSNLTATKAYTLPTTATAATLKF